MIHKPSTKELETGSELIEFLKVLRRYEKEECGVLNMVFLNCKDHLDTIDVFDLPCVKQMSFINCQLKRIPCFTSVTGLSISGGRVESYDDLVKFTDLEVLTLSDLNLSGLPGVLQGCQKLRYLNVNNNKNLVQLPIWIASLPLEYLALHGNGLCDIPELLPKSLKVLMIQNNRIKRISPFLANLRCLSLVCLHGNPLIFPELSIAKSKTRELLAYLKSFLTNTIRNDTVKISLVGQEEVGKSTLLQAIKSATGICDETGSIFKTDGLEISNITLNDLNFRVFDLAGDIDFMETHTMFISEGTLFLAVFDLRMYTLHSVSYTHLTLPTICSV